MSKRTITRRIALVSAAAGVVALPFVIFSRSTTLGYSFSDPAADRSLGLAPSLACTRATRGETEGPYYTPQTPQRTDLREPDTRGPPLVLQGLVLTPDCRPVAGAVIDIWHSDEDGRYDNSGFRYRGHQFTDAAGAFRFETIRPARYPGRTPHIHVKVQGASTRPSHQPALLSRPAGRERPRRDLSRRPPARPEPRPGRLARALRLRALSGLIPGTRTAP